MDKGNTTKERDMPKTLTQTKTRTATYCGQPAEQYELLTAGKAGLRIVVHTWLEDGKQGEAGSGTVRVLSGPHHSAKCLFTEPVAAGESFDAAIERAKPHADA